MFRRSRWAAPTTTPFRPTAQEVCYAMNSDPVPAISTNSDLYVVSIEGGAAAQDHHQRRAPIRARTIRPTASISPGARSSAPGYESDRWRLMVLERATGKLTNLTENLDRWVNSFTWAPDSANLFFTTADRGRQAIQLMSGKRRAPSRIAASGDSELDDMQLTRDGKTMVYTQQTGVVAGGDLSRVLQRRRRRWR